MIRFSVTLEMIAPQHGSIIPRRLVRFLIGQLKNIDCGLYLMAQTSSEIKKLSRLNSLLHDFVRSVVLHRKFSDIASVLVGKICDVLPVSELRFVAAHGVEEFYELRQDNMYLGVGVSPPDEIRGIIGLKQAEWLQRFGAEVIDSGRLGSAEESLFGRGRHKGLVLPLFGEDSDAVHAIAAFLLTENVTLDDELARALGQLGKPLSVAVERETILRGVELERQRFYDQAIRDPLTQLYTRVYLHDSAKRAFGIQDRDPSIPVSLVMLDIDHFKQINDSFGHGVGDTVLSGVASVVLTEIRPSDIAVRVGGEELAILTMTDSSVANLIAGRIRKEVAEHRWAELPVDFVVSVSGGVAQCRRGEVLEDLMRRADEALYRAKRGGRNQVCMADE